MKIPERAGDERVFFERLKDPVVLTRRIGERDIRFIVEPTPPRYFYPCSVDDACRVLGAIATSVRDLEFVVFRHPSSKQRLLRPVWGRAVFWYEFRKQHGAAVIIESQRPGMVRWNRSQGPDGRAELDRLRADGHRVERTRRGYEVHQTPESMRNTVLFRTLLHEVGHHVDFDRSDVETWKGKNSRVKEDYAHRFAGMAVAYLSNEGHVPFPPLLDHESMRHEGLDPAWFVADPQVL
ncbi:ImmA/IrrE family metallo-endopeptidase [Hydrogenophaga sp. A37]|uniref:ImmA/IrrE family metallo-endopeptidase n=1 Tax=Hydrogenophaga sp. A37 TaxID=1945864 RepID=UPI00098486F5|nr:hypothetical protein [Hydrogenophaga sp. A37]